MSLENIGLFKAIGSKMNYLNQQQRVTSQNIANSDTPGYQPMRLKEVDFGTILKDVTNRQGVGINTTNKGHMPSPNSIATPREDEQRTTYEVAPAGNAVIMEEQLLNAGKTVADYNLMTNLLQKNVGLIQIALGTQR